MSGLKRYQNPEVYEALAAEYVLGTLTGRARRRFERLIDERPYIRYAVEMWEGKLNPMVELLPETEPPAHVWKSIKNRISETNPQIEKHSAQAASGWWSIFRSPGFWQATTAVLAVTLGMRALLPVAENAAPMSSLSYISVLEGEGDKPMVVTMGHKQRRVVSVRLMETPKMKNQGVLELWAIKSPDTAPVRIGIVPSDRKQTYIKLSEQQWKRMKGAKQFAITVEPRDREQNELPSGPIMYKGKCIDFI